MFTSRRDTLLYLIDADFPVKETIKIAKDEFWSASNVYVKELGRYIDLCSDSLLFEQQKALRELESLNVVVKEVTVKLSAFREKMVLMAMNRELVE